MNSHLLTGMILLPFLGALFQALTQNTHTARWLGLGSSIASSILGAVVLTQIDPGAAGAQLLDRLPWIGSYAISYELAVDGTNVLLLLLLSAVFPVLLASEWERERGVRGLYALLLLLQGALIGACCAQDLFLLFFFWGFTALPIFFLVGIWGGPGKESAAFRALVTNTIGNAFLFAAFVLIYYSKDPHTFLLNDLVAGGGIPARSVSIVGLEIDMSVLSFVFLCLGLALRAPVWPAHGWFLQVATEAPASVFVATAAVTVPVATLIFARLANRLFPEILDAAALWILIAGALNLFVGSVTVLNQKKLSGILALLAMSHLGLGLIGLGSQNGNALAGVIYHQLGVGLAVAAMGLLFGGIVKRAGFTELTGSSAGLAERAPAAAAMSGLAIAAFLGIPGMSGFVGQSLIVMGGFSTHPAVLFAVGAAMVLIAYSLFGLFRQLFLGAPSPGEGDSGKGLDLSTRERFLMAPLVGLMILLGFYPKPFLDWVRPTAVSLVERGGNSAMSGPAPESNPMQPAEPKGP